VAQDSRYTRTSTHGPRTTDHGAGRVGLVIFLFKRRHQMSTLRVSKGCRRGVEVSTFLLKTATKVYK